MKKEEIIKIFGSYDIKVLDTKKANNSYKSNVYVVYTKDEKYILKINRNREKRINEQKYYNYLYKFVPTSKVLYSGVYKNKDYNIISFFEGKNIYDEECNSLSSNEIFNMGRLLANIHNCKIIDKDDDSWIMYLNNCIEKTYIELSNLFGKDDNDLIASFLINYINESIKNNYENCLLHMDFRVGNIIIDKDKNSGIIDLESMRNGDYVFDFVKMYRNFNKDKFIIFLNGYQVKKKIESNFYERLEFYSFFDSYTSLYWCYVNNQMEGNFFKLNYEIVLKYLRKLKNGKRII